MENFVARLFHWFNRIWHNNFLNWGLTSFRICDILFIIFRSYIQQVVLLRAVSIHHFFHELVVSFVVTNGVKTFIFWLLPKFFNLRINYFNLILNLVNFHTFISFLRFQIFNLENQTRSFNSIILDFMVHNQVIIVLISVTFEFFILSSGMLID